MAYLTPLKECLMNAHASVLLGLLFKAGMYDYNQFQACILWLRLKKFNNVQLNIKGHAKVIYKQSDQNWLIFRQKNQKNWDTFHQVAKVLGYFLPNCWSVGYSSAKMILAFLELFGYFRGDILVALSTNSSKPQLNTILSVTPFCRLPWILSVLYII